MTFQQSRHSSDTTSELSETKAKGNAMSPERQTLGVSRAESDRYLSLNSDTPAERNNKWYMVAIPGLSGRIFKNEAKTGEPVLFQLVRL